MTGAIPLIRVDAIAWMAGLIPLATVNLCYLLAASLETVPWCFPYLDGCTSISRAARQEPVNFLFRAVMLPWSALLMLYWWLCSTWLTRWAPAAFCRRRAILALGVIGALFQILYTTFLGVEGETYQWLRRYGINIYFSFTVLAQILLMSLLARDHRLPAWLRRGKLGLCALMLGLGLLSLPLQYIVADRDSLLNAIEWSYSLLMASYFPLTALVWRRSGFGMQTVLKLNP